MLVISKYYLLENISHVNWCIMLKYWCNVQWYLARNINFKLTRNKFKLIENKIITIHKIYLLKELCWRATKTTRQHRSNMSWFVLAGGLSCPPAQIAICAGTRVLAGISPTSTDMIWPPQQIVSGLVGAQLLFQEADPLLSVSGEMVFLAEHGGQLADDGAHHARGGPRHHFGHLYSQALALSQMLARL